ncbi:MAG: GDP-L-fucose synthase [Bacteroidales bacterium]|nr:GDP-L-fucose synthase [Bacteroidales bacterium]
MLDFTSKIFVAGHRGLVGSAIWNNLVSRGFTNLVGRTHSELDLEDPVAVRAFFDAEQPDAVVLAAAHVGGIMANLRYRADFIYKNLQIQQNVIGESWRHGVKKLLFLGSTCIYPREAPQPMGEDCLLTSPLEYTNEPYAIAKIAGLKMCESFSIQYGCNYIAVMPTNLYGPGDNFHLERSHVLPAMIRKFHLASCLEKGDWDAVRKDVASRPVTAPGLAPVNGESPEDEILAMLAYYGITPSAVTLWGTGSPMREFLWSEEMADASVHVLLNVDFKDTFRDAVTNSDGILEIRNCHINVGTGEELSIKDLAYKVKAVTGFAGSIVWDRSKPDGTPLKRTDVSKLHSLGWHHRIGIDEGIGRLYDWYVKT